ncbi:VIT1/CCC1 transporter family protein [Alkanindiges illinoisensis]|uniref:VIT family protein n=1 Tax=Alkanindiges illinoisensis TaxID=197183 RepID=A0A4Y7XBP9_9GAMM|nr:VIT family protein [Alkanindiges illinoisensis]TEU26430.1 VIT family protein [Alkanindiges illinoisensis]
MAVHHHEVHFSHRMGWLRAAVLGANDGIISVASLIVGVAASGTNGNALLLTGIAGLVAGAVSMAAGEYVSVQSQADTEKADLQKEALELKRNPDFELNELKQIYIERGLQPELALEVAMQLSQHDALHAHARDEIGISEINSARPVQAALASAASFTLGAIFPILAMVLSPADLGKQAVFMVTCIALLLLGGLASYAGGASLIRGALRVLCWGLLAMLCTHLIGGWFGTLM